MEHIKKPEWLKINIGTNPRYTETKRIVDTHRLHTICSSGRCPNLGECWGKGTATFLIGGNICTRSCKFCNTPTGKPLPLDTNEPTRVAESIRLMKLNHAVLTSVDRDDLSDFGAEHWVKTIQAIRQLNPQTTLEALIPDFQGKEELIRQVTDTKPDIVSHNLETVRRLTPSVRSVARYETSLRVIHIIADSGVTAKSGIMVGLGETETEVAETMDDLLENGSDTDYRTISATYPETLSGSCLYYSRTICFLQRNSTSKRFPPGRKWSFGTLILLCRKTNPTVLNLLMYEIVTYVYRLTEK